VTAETQRDEWLARIGAALCAASRPLGAASLALAGFDLGCLYFSGVDDVQAALLSVAVGAGVAQAYFAFHVEFDRRIFESLAARRADGDLQAFDAAARLLELLPRSKTGRPLAARVRGLMQLAMALGWILAFQVALTLGAFWVPE
jgi:hypothetical protein